jgi:hypothetical protein
VKGAPIPLLRGPLHLVDGEPICVCGHLLRDHGERLVESSPIPGRVHMLCYLCSEDECSDMRPVFQSEVQ